MSMIGTKTPDEVKDYSLDWSKDIGSDIITSTANSTWSVSPAGVTVTQATLAANGTLTTVWLSGGTAGQVYLVKNKITTTAGRSLSKTFRLLVMASDYL